MYNTQYAIETKDMGYQVGKEYLLKNITLKITPGEHCLLYGLNGSGKTTLLSILAGYRRQTAGELYVFGEKFSNETVLELRKQIGWISSSFFDTKYRHERVRDIVLSGKFGTYGIDWDISSKDENRVKDLLTALGLEDKQHLSYDRLSKGQRQNVLIARAFMGQPEILLLDEPYSGLDVLAKARFMELLEKLMQNKDLTVLFVSHEINDVSKAFDNTLMLRNGRCFAQGKTEDLFQTANLSVFFQQSVEVGTKEETLIKPTDERKQLKMDLFL